VAQRYLLSPMQSELQPKKSGRLAARRNQFGTTTKIQKRVASKTHADVETGAEKNWHRSANGQ